MEDEVDEAETPEDAAPAGWRTCPRCGQTHHPSTSMCASCGMDLTVRSGGQLLGPKGQPAVSHHAPGPSNTPRPAGPTLQCRTCGSNDIELIQP
jgi:ribosomal protein L37E